MFTLLQKFIVMSNIILKNVKILVNLATKLASCLTSQIEFLNWIYLTVLEFEQS